MFATYFPSTKQLTEAPVFAMVDYSIRGQCIVRSRPYNQNQPYNFRMDVKAAKGNLLRQEERVGVMMINGNILLPLRDCVFSPDGSNAPTAALSVKEKRIVPFVKGLISPEFNGCHVWETPIEIDALTMSLFARATKFTTKESIAVPRITHRLPDQPINPFAFRTHGPHQSNRKGYVLEEGKWCAFKGSDIFDMETGKEIKTAVDIDKRLVVIHELQESIFSKDDMYTFRNSVERTNLYVPITHEIVINHTCPETDPEFGKKFYDSLGIAYDVYDEVTFHEDGMVDTSTMVEGKHDFGVMKRKVHVLRAKYVENLITAAVAFVDKMPDKQREGYFDSYEGAEHAGFDRMDAVRSKHDFADVVVTIEENPDASTKRHLLNGHRLGQIIRDISDSFIGSAHEYFDLPKYKPEENFHNWTNCHQFSDACVERLFDELTEVVEIYVPITTPRFTDESNAILQAFYNYSGYRSADQVFESEVNTVARF